MLLQLPDCFPQKRRAAKKVSAGLGAKRLQFDLIAPAAQLLFKRCRFKLSGLACLAFRSFFLQVDAPA
jgi:hypothetical protein